MSEMVERVARVLAEACALEPFDDLSREKYIGDARAAIEAMREPTDAMKLAGQALAYEGWGDGSEIAKLSWQTMIDAALGQKP